MNRRKDRRLRIRAVYREEPDVPRLSRALLALAEAQLEAEAQAAHQHERPEPKAPPEGDQPKDAA